MTNEEKALFLQDLSARLPYNLQLRCFDLEVDEDNSYTGNKICSDQALFGINLLNIETEYTESSPIICVDEDGQEGCYSLDNIKPYLRPMSSMTDSEKTELELIGFRYKESHITNEYMIKGYNYIKPPYTPVDEVKCSEVIDFFNSRHLDYHGLIEKGLALKAPEDMYDIQNQPTA